MIFLRTDWIRRINRKIIRKLSFHDSRKAAGSDPRLVHIAKEVYLLDGKGATQCLFPSLHILAIMKSLVSSDLMQNGNGKKWGMFSEGDYEEEYISIRPSFHCQEVTCERK